MRLVGCLALMGCGFQGRAVDSDARTIPMDSGVVVDGAPVVVPVTGCPALPPSEISIVVSTTAMLQAAVQAVPANGVIAIADGIYDLSSGLTLATPGVTLRSVSGDPTKVTLQGGAMPTLTIVASDVKIAEVTLEQATTIAILVEGTASADTLGVQIYNVVFANAGGPAMRIMPFGGTVAGPFADTGTIACSQFVDTAADNHCLNTTLGIDGQAARGWIVRDNVFSGLNCHNEFERAVIFRYGSRDTQIVRNQFHGSNMNLALGIDGGNSRAYTDPLPAGCTGLPDHLGGLVCDNVIDGLVVPALGPPEFDTGIALWATCDTWVMHNTIVSPAGNQTFHDIEYRFAQTYVHLVNNLVEQIPASRDGGIADPASLGSNVAYGALTDFVDATGGDFHLAPAAPEKPGIALTAAAMCQMDADGRPRNLAQPSLGAYEHN